MKVQLKFGFETRGRPREVNECASCGRLFESGTQLRHHAAVCVEAQAEARTRREEQ